MPASRTRTHVIQVNADSTDLLDAVDDWNTIPSGVRVARYQTQFSDYDAKFKIKVGDAVLMEDSAAHLHAADNLGLVDWSKAHDYIMRPRAGSKVDIEIDETTAGEGLVAIRYEY